MSDVCGIFNKSCPQCATTLAKSAPHCECGYSFAEDAPASALAQTLAEEKLYEDYLLARVTQTAQAAIEAQAQQRQRPDDMALRNAALVALETAESARRDLAAQSERVEALRQAMLTEAKPAPIPARPAQVAHAAAPKSLQGARTAAKTESTPPSITHEDTAPAPTPANGRAAEVARAAEALRSELAKLRHNNERAAVAPARVLRSGNIARKSGTLGNAARDTGDTAPVETRAHTQAATASGFAPPFVPEGATGAKKRCPECDVAINKDAHRCRCGYAFVPTVAAAPISAVAPAVAPTSATRDSANLPKIEDVLARAHELKQARRESAQAQKAARIREARLARAAKRPQTSATEGAPMSAAPAIAATPNTAVSARVAESDGREGATSAVASSDRRTALANTGGEHGQRPVGACIAPARPLTAVAAREGKECPNCTATIATPAARCKCGFELGNAAADVMPALCLDDSELLKVKDLYVRR